MFIEYKRMNSEYTNVILNRSINQAMQSYVEQWYPHSLCPTSEHPLHHSSSTRPPSAASPHSAAAPGQFLYSSPSLASSVQSLNTKVTFVAFTQVRSSQIVNLVSWCSMPSPLVLHCSSFSLSWVIFITDGQWHLGFFSLLFSFPNLCVHHNNQGD